VERRIASGRGPTAARCRRFRRWATRLPAAHLRADHVAPDRQENWALADGGIWLGLPD
jgi:hypothetical protein